jgi:hypothetical protein
MAASYGHVVATRRHLSGTAIASLTLSLAGFLGLVLIGPLLGVIFGHVAMNQIKKSNGLVGGRGVAMVGLIIGYVGFVLSVILLAILGYAIYLITTYPP